MSDKVLVSRSDLDQAIEQLEHYMGDFRGDACIALRAALSAPAQDHAAVVLNKPKLRRIGFLTESGKLLPHGTKLFAEPVANEVDRLNAQLLQSAEMILNQGITIRDLRAEYETLKVLVEIGQGAIGERNAAEHSLAEATRLLEAYGGGVSEIEEWLKNQ